MPTTYAAGEENNNRNEYITFAVLTLSAIGTNEFAVTGCYVRPVFFIFRRQNSKALDYNVYTLYTYTERFRKASFDLKTTRFKNENATTG